MRAASRSRVACRAGIAMPARNADETEREDQINQGSATRRIAHRHRAKTVAWLLE